jgi:SAM-dependent methyltransferase
MSTKKIAKMASATMGTQYATNSSIQMSALTYSTQYLLPIVSKHIQEQLLSTGNTHLHVADIGCATGENSLPLMSQVVDIITSNTSTGNKSDITVHFCDLPSNQWSTLFTNISKESKFQQPNVYSTAVGKSMFHKLFPDNSMDVIFSASAMHWLNTESIDDSSIQKLKNGKYPNIVYYGLSNPNDYESFYKNHVERDWKQIVDLRYSELKPNGLFVCTLFCSPLAPVTSKVYPSWIASPNDPPRSVFFELMNQVALQLVREKIIEQSEYNRFVIPMWPRTPDQHLKELVHSNRFEIVREEVFNFKLPFGGLIHSDVNRFATIMSGFLRGFSSQAFKACLNQNRAQQELEYLVNQYYSKIQMTLASTEKKILEIMTSEEGTYYAIVAKKIQ